MGFDAPKAQFGDIGTALATAGTIAVSIQTFGATATTSELLIATLGIEKVVMGGSLFASFYVGVVIASLMLAMDQSLKCTDYNITDMHLFLDRNKLKLKKYNELYHKHPRIFKDLHKVKRPAVFGHGFG